jgi:putative sensor protein
MSYTIMANPINTGVRRLSTLTGFEGWGLGELGTPPDPDTLAQLQAAGYDMQTIQTAIALGATDEQLLALPFPASPQEIADATQQLMNQVGATLPATGAPASSAGGYPKGAIPQFDTSLGHLDLSLRSTWDSISSMFSQVGAGLNAVAARNPNDPTVVQMRTEYNSLANQFSSIWSRVFNSPPPPIQTLGTWQEDALSAGILILGGVAIASGVGIPLALGFVAIAEGLAAIQRWLANQNAQTAVAQTQAYSQQQAQQTAANLTSTYQQQTAAANKAYAAGNKAMGDHLAAQAAATLKTIQSLAAAPPSGPTDWSAWFQKNFGLLILGLVGIAVVPVIVRKF